MPTSHLEMHNEHRQWQSDEAMWRDDVSKWLRDAWEACRNFETVRSGFEEFNKELDAHTVALEKARAGVACHEHALAEYAKGSTETGLIGMAKLHQKSADRHAENEAAHHRLKLRHQAIFSHWLGLLKALRPASAEPQVAPTLKKVLIEA